MAIREEFQRLFMMSEPEALSLNAQAALGAVHPPQRSQFSLLVRHFLERFFNHETASPDGDAKSRLILIAVATGIPGFMVALYLWPVYHPFIGWPPGRALNADPPPYWLQVNHHFFFVIFSFVALGIVTVFEWDLFFPDLLDVFVLTPLPIQDRRLFQARVAAIGIFIVGFLLDANLLAPLVIPASFDSPNLHRLLIGHILAVLGAGLFSAAFMLALQGALLSLLGEALLRRISLLLQGLSITLLLMLLSLFPVLSGAVPVFLQSGSRFVLYCPPFWFLGVYQRLLEGPAALPIYGQLAKTGSAALLITIAIAMLSYPIAYLRRVRQLVVGPGTHDTRNWAARPLHPLLHATSLRQPICRAVFHFISQTLMRVQRYRTYLVLYEGVGLSVVVASVLRLSVEHGQVRMEISADGVRAAITLVALAASRAFAPPELLTWPATASMLLIAAALCLLLTDGLFLNVKTVAFTGEPAREQPNLALTVLKYFTFFPVILWIPVASEPWIEASFRHFLIAAFAVAAVHFAIKRLHRCIVNEHCNMPGLEDDEEDFPMKLGLRY